MNHPFRPRRPAQLSPQGVQVSDRLQLLLSLIGQDGWGIGAVAAQEPYLLLRG